MDFRKVGVWAATIFIGLMFLMNGSTKIMQSAAWQERFVNQWGLPAWMVMVTAIAELVGGALILFPRTAVYGGAIIAAVMLGAAGTHLMAGEYANIAVNALFGGLAAFVAWFRCPGRANE